MGQQLGIRDSLPMRYCLTTIVCLGIFASALGFAQAPTTANTGRTAEGTRPLRVFRYRNPTTRAMAFTTEATSRKSLPSSFVREDVDESVASSPSFYLYTEPFRSTIPVYRFMKADGVMFFSSENERPVLRARGLKEVGEPLFVYDRKVEGSSEVFRVTNPNRDDVLYTTSADEKDFYLKQGWAQLPSLGFAQSTSSSGTGILRDTTIKLEANDLMLLTSTASMGEKIEFGRTHPKIGNLIPGTILYSEKSSAFPSGLVAKIVKISPTTSGGVKIETVPAELHEAFLELHLYLDNRQVYFISSRSGAGVEDESRRLSRMDAPSNSHLKRPDDTLRPEYLAGPIAAVTVLPDGAYWSQQLNYDNDLYNSTIGSATANLHVNGQLNLDATAELVYNCNNPCSVDPTITFLLSPHASGSITITATGQLSTQAEKQLLGPYGATFAVGGIPISVDLTLYAGFEASATVTASLKANLDTQMTAGVLYDQTTNQFSPLACPNPCPVGFTCGPTRVQGPTCALSPSVTGSLTADGQVAVYLRPELNLILGSDKIGIGPTAYTKLQFRAAVELPNLNLYAELIPGLGAKKYFWPWESYLWGPQDFPDFGLSRLLKSTPLISPTPRLTITPSYLNFGDVSVWSTGSQYLTLTNSGSAGFNITKINLSDTPHFARSSVSFPIYLAPSASKQISVAFTPTTTSTQLATLTVGTDTSAIPDQVVQVFGTGLSLSYLPAPSPLTPANNATNVSVTPVFSWNPISGATSYRIMVARTPSDIPSDPTISACTNCVLNDISSSASYVSPVALQAVSTYYWQVHARSPTQYGTWSNQFRFTSGTPPSDDFSIQMNPNAISAIQGASATSSVLTSTTSGSAQTLNLSISNLPAGVTPSFSPGSITSGSTSTVTLNIASTTLAGTYTFVISGVGGKVSHSTQGSLTINAAASGNPVVSLTPASISFSDQTVGTNSPTQPFTLRNTGGGMLTVSAVSYAAGSDYNIASLGSFPFNLAPNATITFPVYFSPSTTGLRPGIIYIWDNAPGSPHPISLIGNGLAAPPTTGTIQVNMTLNGQPLPKGNSAYYTLAGPSPQNDYFPAAFKVPPGTYTLQYGGTSNFLTLASITPSTSQQVSAGGVISFTMNFTAANDFMEPFFGSPAGSGTPQVVQAGGTATFYIRYSYPSGSAITPITMQLLGAPPGVSLSFSSQPALCCSDVTITTNTQTPPGTYTLVAAGTNTSGLTRKGIYTSTLVITAPPAQPAQLVSLTTNGVLANGISTSRNGMISADGRYVVFVSTAANLGISQGSYNGAFVRDRQTGTTTLASIDNTGNPVSSVYSPSLSANGRFLVFGAGSSQNHIYCRDLQLAVTEQVDVASDGTPANGMSGSGVVSADGRFVVFNSSATNLVQGGSVLGKLYIRDRRFRHTSLACVGNDGSLANQQCYSAAMSADGRYVAFSSSATNLVAQTMNGKPHAFVRDMQMGQTTLVSAALDGSPADQGITDYGSLAITADGRFIVFESYSTNVVSQPVSDTRNHLFVRDIRMQQSVLVDSDVSGIPLGFNNAFGDPSISADGRFVAFSDFSHILLRDMLSNQTRAISVTSVGTPGNGMSSTPAINSGGSIIAFTSLASNLISGDTNWHASRK
jgi:hypothetical protein